MKGEDIINDLIVTGLAATGVFAIVAYVGMKLFPEGKPGVEE